MAVFTALGQVIAVGPKLIYKTSVKLLLGSLCFIQQLPHKLDEDFKTLLY
jgi:hypothetical protein